MAETEPQPLQRGSPWLREDGRWRLHEWACLLAGIEPHGNFTDGNRKETLWFRLLKEQYETGQLTIAVDDPHRHAYARLTRAAVIEAAERIGLRPHPVFFATVTEKMILDVLKEHLAREDLKTAEQATAKELGVSRKLVHAVYEANREIRRPPGRPRSAPDNHLK